MLNKGETAYWLAAERACLPLLTRIHSSHTIAQPLLTAFTNPLGVISNVFCCSPVQVVDCLTQQFL